MAMLEHRFIKKMHPVLLWIVLGLAIIALAAELLPEVEAKMIVVPTLLLVIGLSVMELWLLIERVKFKV
jgi:hypothetical protein